MTWGEVLGWTWGVLILVNVAWYTYDAVRIAREVRNLNRSQR